MPIVGSSVFSSFQSHLTVPGFRAPSFDAFFVEAAFVGVDNEAREVVVSDDSSYNSHQQSPLFRIHDPFFQNTRNNKISDRVSVIG
jgi:hypothetical protein